MKRYIRSSSRNNYIVVLQDGELLKGDKGEIMQLNDEVETASVNSLAEASAAVREYIDKKLLGSSTFTGGAVLDGKTHKQVARISYNGRIWDLDGNEITDADMSNVHASMDLEDLEDALLKGKAMEAEAFDEYFNAYHEPEKDAIAARDVKVGDFIRNTECAEEIDIGDVFEVIEISSPKEDSNPIWREFDYVFHILDHTNQPPFAMDLHYMADELVGVRVDRSAVEAATEVVDASAIDSLSKDSYQILEDTLIDLLNDVSDEAYNNFPNNQEAVEDFIARIRDLCDMDEYEEAHPDEVEELRALSDEDLIEISEKIWEIL